MARVENEKWEKHRNEKLKKELEKTVSKQENENQHFHKKMKLILNEFKKNLISFSYRLGKVKSEQLNFVFFPFKFIYFYLNY